MIEWLDATEVRPVGGPVVWVTNGTQVALATRQVGYWHLVDPDARPLAGEVTHWCYVPTPTAPGRPLAVVR